MPDPNNRTGRDFSFYDAMDDEQLRQILRDDASKPEGEDTDMELMLHIMEVLAKRRKEAQEDISPEVALEEFKNKYTYTDNSLISEEKPAKKKTIGFHRWQRWVATLAAMLILVFGSALTAQAFGFDIFEIIAKWTQETFRFGYANNQEGTINSTLDADSPYASLQEALDKYYIANKVVPQWIPDGYTEVDVNSQQTPKKRLFTANYESSDKSIRVRIADYIDSVPMEIEQSGTLVEVYTRNDIDYYIFENLGDLQAAWINGNLECYISGPLSLPEIKSIIDSIEKE